MKSFRVSQTLPCLAPLLNGKISPMLILTKDFMPLLMMVGGAVRLRCHCCALDKGNNVDRNLLDLPLDQPSLLFLKTMFMILTMIMIR